MLAILSGSRSFTRSEVRRLMAGIRRISGEGTEIFFGTSPIPADADEFYLTLIVWWKTSALALTRISRLVCKANLMNDKPELR